MVRREKGGEKAALLRKKVKLDIATNRFSICRHAVLMCSVFRSLSCGITFLFRVGNIYK
jgi:hypothetical protein